jgi:superfamily I DNA/RNA helicase
MTEWLQPVNRFTIEQKDIYDQLLLRINDNSNYSAIVKGAAGTGKTLILAQLALQIRGRRGIFFIYTNALRNFLISSMERADTNYADMQTGVETFYKWLFGVYRSNIGGPFPQGEFSEKTDKMIGELIQNVSPNSLDYLLIDEGQDFSPKVIKLLKIISKKLIFVGDANQSLYEQHNNDLKDLTKIIDADENYNLSISIRISPSILRFMGKYVLKIYSGIKTARREDSRDSKPLIYNKIPLEDFLNYFMKEVALNYLHSNKNLAIVCRHNEDVDYIYSLVESLTSGSEVYRVNTSRDQNIDFSESAVYCLTMHSCKGLEFDNLLYLNINNELTGGVKLFNNLAYTAYTRAREDLIIYSMDEKIPLFDYLDFDYATTIENLPSLNDNEDVDFEDLI